MQITFFDEMRIYIMHFALQSFEKNIRNSKCNEATDFFESNISVNL